jgi:hypothetical protein
MNNLFFTLAVYKLLTIHAGASEPLTVENNDQVERQGCLNYYCNRYIHDKYDEEKRFTAVGDNFGGAVFAKLQQDRI